MIAHHNKLKYILYFNKIAASILESASLACKITILQIYGPASFLYQFPSLSQES